jgi:hypothetical protein
VAVDEFNSGGLGGFVDGGFGAAAYVNTTNPLASDYKLLGLSLVSQNVAQFSAGGFYFDTYSIDIASPNISIINNDA